jgi:hypothetical protein
MKQTSKDRRHAARKRIAMKKGQRAALVLGRGIDPTGLVDGYGLIRVTPDGIFLYAQ